MFIPGLLLLKVLSRYILLGLIDSIKTKKSSFSKPGLGRLFLAKPFLRFGKSNS